MFGSSGDLEEWQTLEVNVTLGSPWVTLTSWGFAIPQGHPRAQALFALSHNHFVGKSEVLYLLYDLSFTFPFTFPI